MKSFFNHAITSLSTQSAPSAGVVARDEAHDVDEMDVDSAPLSPCKDRGLRKGATPRVTDTDSGEVNKDQVVTWKTIKKTRIKTKEEEKIFEFIDFRSCSSLSKDEDGDDDVQYEVDDTVVIINDDSLLKRPSARAHGLQNLAVTPISNRTCSPENRPNNLPNNGIRTESFGGQQITFHVNQTTQDVEDDSDDDWNISFLTLKYRQQHKEDKLMRSSSHLPALTHQNAVQATTSTSHGPQSQSAAAAFAHKHYISYSKTGVNKLTGSGRFLFPVSLLSTNAVDINQLVHFKENVTNLELLRRLGHNIVKYDTRSIGMGTHISGQHGIMDISAPCSMVHDPDFGNFVGCVRLRVEDKSNQLLMESDDWDDWEDRTLGPDGVKKVLRYLDRGRVGKASG